MNIQYYATIILIVQSLKWDSQRCDRYVDRFASPVSFRFFENSTEPSDSMCLTFGSADIVYSIKRADRAK